MANGQFVPNDPAVHGRKQREENRKSFFGFNSNRVKDSNEVFTPNRQNVIAHETVISNPPNQRAKLDGHNKNNVYERSSYDSNNVTQRLEKPDSAVDKINGNLLHSSYTGPLDKIVKTNLKLEEFKILLNRCLLHSSYTGPLDKIVKTNLKLEEFKILLNRCYPEYQVAIRREISIIIILYTYPKPYGKNLSMNNELVFSVWPCDSVILM
jgi:hypothetical protein